MRKLGSHVPGVYRSKAHPKLRVMLSNATKHATCCPIRSEVAFVQHLSYADIVSSSSKAKSHAKDQISTRTSRSGPGCSCRVPFFFSRKKSALHEKWMVRCRQRQPKLGILIKIHESKERVSLHDRARGSLFAPHFARKYWCKTPVVISEENPIHFAASRPSSGRSVYSCS